jgi:hypothetical protein
MELDLSINNLNFFEIFRNITVMFCTCVIFNDKKTYQIIHPVSELGLGPTVLSLSSLSCWSFFQISTLSAIHRFTFIQMCPNLGPKQFCQTVIMSVTFKFWISAIYSKLQLRKKVFSVNRCRVSCILK